MSENKNIGMAINYDYHDYGGMLQAYASFRKIKDLGYEPEAIDISCITKDIKKRKIKYFTRNIFDLSIVKEKSQIIFKKIRQKINRKFYLNLSKRDRAFDLFYKEKFKISKKYVNWIELSKGCRDYRAVIVGSDQLWLPSNIAGDYYTLSFVPDDVKKIAYATSFGVSKITKGLEEKTKKFLSRIDYLSAREESGQKIIKQTTGRDVQLVCDPALLLTAEEWDKEATPGKMIEGKYIFCYFMGNNPWQREFVKLLKERTGYKIIALLHLDQYIKNDDNYVDEAPYDVSPADFLNLVKNAEYVCTDSFHGTVFSIIFQKKFFTFKRFSEKATLSTNSRIDTLLGKMNLMNRLIDKNTSVDTLISKEIDYLEVKQLLDNFRKESIKYLVVSLEA